MIFPYFWTQAVDLHLLVTLGLCHPHHHHHHQTMHQRMMVRKRNDHLMPPSRHPYSTKHRHHLLNGGCKHAIALLSWLHRHSEEPPVTSVSCYWKSSKLSRVGRTLKFIKGKNLGKGTVNPLPPSNGLFLNAVLEKRKTLEKEDTVLTKYFKEASFVEKISMHHFYVFVRTNTEPIQMIFYHIVVRKCPKQFAVKQQMKPFNSLRVAYGLNSAMAESQLLKHMRVLIAIPWTAPLLKQF